MIEASDTMQLSSALKQRPVRRREGLWWRAARSFSRNPAALLALSGFLAIVFVAIFAPLLAPFDPVALNYDAPLALPSGSHLFGTDDLGRDIFSRVLWGGRESLKVGLIGVFLSMFGGVTIGLTSGFFGGIVDIIAQRLIDIMMAFPTILLMIAIVAVLGPGLTTIMIALGIATIPGFSRVVRGCVLSARNYEYVTAARVVGVPPVGIMVRHVLPNVIPPVIIFATLNLGSAIMMTAGLSYLGLGAQPPSPEWGAMLNQGRTFIRDSWWLSVFPGAMISFCVLCINIVGDGLRDALDPKMSR